MSTDTDNNTLSDPGGRALVMIDLQHGFMTAMTEHIAPRLDAFLDAHRDDYTMLAATRFINTPDSAFVRQLGWKDMMEGTPGTMLIEEVARWMPRIIEKHSYSGEHSELSPIITSHVGYAPGAGVDVCGVDTEACVYLTAVTLMESGLDVRVIWDLCASNGGSKMHNHMRPVFQRSLGDGHIITTRELEQ